MTGKGKFNWKKEKNLMTQIQKINKTLKIGVLKDEGKLNEAPTSKATVSSPKNWHDNMWNASGELLRVVYWLSSLQLKGSDSIKKDAKLKRIIDNLKKLERQLEKHSDKMDMTEGKLTEDWNSGPGFS